MSDTSSESSDVEFLDTLVGDDRYYEEVQARLEDPNEAAEPGYSFLHIAAWSQEENPRILKLLLERGADVNSATEYGFTPLHFAVASRKRYAVDAFLEAGAVVNKSDVYGRTALHLAMGSNWTYPPVPVVNLPCDMWTVKRLLCLPEIDLNPKDNAGSTPLMWAVRRRNSHAVQELLKKGANPNIANNYRTPLHRALFHSSPNLQIAHALLQNGAGIYCEDCLGKTPIDILVENVQKNNTLLFAKHVVCLIALLYRIKGSLKHKLKPIPELLEYFEKCCKEVHLMKNQVIYDKFNLHDFALNCYQTRFIDNNRDIYTPVIPLLLSGSYVQYLNFIMERL